MVSYLLVAKKMPRDYLYDLKQKELFIIFTYNYIRKELAEFFYLVLGYGTNFKQRFQAIYKNGLSIKLMRRMKSQNEECPFTFRYRGHSLFEQILSRGTYTILFPSKHLPG